MLVLQEDSHRSSVLVRPEKEMADIREIASDYLYLAKDVELTGRVAVLLRQGREIRMLCPDQKAALQWMKEHWQKDDEWVCIKNWDWRLGEARLRYLGKLDE